MKRLVSWILALSCLVLMAGQGFAATRFLSIGTGPVGGTYYPVGATMAKIWTDRVPDLKATAQSTGGTRNNIQLMGKGEAEVIFADGLYYDAYNGRGHYKDNPQTFLRALVPLYPEAVHILIAKGSKIRTLQDLKGKRVSVGAVGGSVSLTANQVFRAVGINPAKDITLFNLGHAESVQAFSNRQIDAAFTVGAIGIASVVEPTTLGLVDFLDVPDGVVQRLMAETPYYAPLTIPAGSYKGQDKPVKTFSSPNILAVDKKLDAALAYRLTKELFAHKPELVAVSARMSALSPEGVAAIRIPLHVGARRYFEEIGVLPRKK